MSFTALSLDLSSNVGFALVRDGLLAESGSFHLGNAAQYRGLRFVRYNNWLLEKRKAWGFREIFFESVPRFESAGWAKVYCGLLAITEAFCATQNIRIGGGISPTDLKTEFAGNCRADKALICKVCHALGWQHGKPGTDMDADEGDAVAIAYVMMKRRGVELEFAR